MELIEAKIVKVEKFYEGKRVLLDFMENFDSLDYILVGNTSNGFFPLVCENHESKDYMPRTFRFNCGAIHQYILVDNDKVKYIDELRPGDEVIIHSKNETKKYHIGRIKIEIRPFIKITACSDNTLFSVILQDGETIALWNKDNYIHANQLKNDMIVYISKFGKATHLGNAIEEYIEEI